MLFFFVKTIDWDFFHATLAYSNSDSLRRAACTVRCGAENKPSWHVIPAGGSITCARIRAAIGISIIAVGSIPTIVPRLSSSLLSTACSSRFCKHKSSLPLHLPIKQKLVPPPSVFKLQPRCAMLVLTRPHEEPAICINACTFDEQDLKWLPAPKKLSLVTAIISIDRNVHLFRTNGRSIW